MQENLNPSSYLHVNIAGRSVGNLEAEQVQPAGRGGEDAGGRVESPSKVQIQVVEDNSAVGAVDRRGVTLRESCHERHFPFLLGWEHHRASVRHLGCMNVLA